MKKIVMLLIVVACCAGVCFFGYKIFTNKAIEKIEIDGDMQTLYLADTVATNKPNFGNAKIKVIYKDGSVYNGSTGEKRFADSSGKFERYGIIYSKNGGTSTYKSKDGVVEIKNNNSEDDAGIVNGKVVDLKNVNIELLKKYIISNNRIFIIKNFDEDSEERRQSYSNIIEFFGGSPIKKSDAWTKGLIKFYMAKNFIAQDKFDNTWWGKDNSVDIDINPVKKTMKIEKGTFNHPMVYNLDGWTGRYGLSQDFLISLHMATLSPEFTSALVKTFNTEVQVYLNDVKEGAEIEAKIFDNYHVDQNIKNEDQIKTYGSDIIHRSTEDPEESHGLSMKDFDEKGDGLLSHSEHWAGLKDDFSGNFVSIVRNFTGGWFMGNEKAVEFFYYTHATSAKTCTQGYESIFPDHVFAVSKDGKAGDTPITGYESLYELNNEGFYEREKAAGWETLADDMFFCYRDINYYSNVAPDELKTYQLKMAQEYIRKQYGLNSQFEKEFLLDYVPGGMRMNDDDGDGECVLVSTNIAPLIYKLVNQVKNKNSKYINFTEEEYQKFLDEVKLIDIDECRIGNLLKGGAARIEYGLRDTSYLWSYDAVNNPAGYWW